MSPRLTVSETPIAGVRTVERITLSDARGSLARLFCARDLEQAGWPDPIAQINHSRTAAQGSIRGLHYQLPRGAERKLVSCIRGEIFDVAVDLRRGSPTFLRWHGEMLSAANGRALLIPQGCAHGFQSLCDDVELIYLHSTFYAPELEGGVSPFDPRLEISWPLPVAAISDRDAGHPPLSPGFDGIPA
jgi:dTDP-4-dehydrorhamnose 3,5-epimerase